MVKVNTSCIYSIQRPQTRSIVRKDAIRHEYLKAVNTTQVFTTPGIVTQIAKHLSPNDSGFKGLFLLFNDSRYRYELKPFTDIEKQLHFNDNHKQTMIKNLQSLFIKFNGLETRIPKATVIIEMYQYLYNNHQHLQLLGDELNITIKKKLNELIEQINITFDDFHYKIYVLSKLYQFKLKLTDQV